MARKKGAKSETPANGQQRPSPAYFMSLSLENVRCFGPKQTLDLSDGKGGWARWTVLLGENGAGKTTVLQALAAIDHTIANSSHAVRKGQKTWWDTPLRFISMPRSSETPGSLESRVGDNGHSTTWPVTFQAQFGGLSTRFDWVDEEYPAPHIAFVCAYGAARRLGASALTEDEVGHSTATLFRDSELVNAEEWLVRVDYSTSKPSPLQERGKLRLRQVIELLIDTLPDVEDVRFVVEGDVMPTARVEFKTPYGWVPLRQLGYGYQTVIAWMVDLASRMVERYPDSPDPLAEPVIVLVDEIDLHLHPTWQRQLMRHLDERFPKAQFIVTAHSPLIAQAAPNANLAVLKRQSDHVVIDNDVDNIRNWRVDQILTSELFGLPTARSPQIEAELERRAELLSKPRPTAAEKQEAEELDARIGHLPAGERREDVEMMQELHEALAIIRKHVPTKP